MVKYRSRPHVSEVPRAWQCLEWSPEYLSKVLGNFEIKGRVAKNSHDIEDEESCETKKQPLNGFLRESQTWERTF